MNVALLFVAKPYFFLVVRTTNCSGGLLVHRLWRIHDVARSQSDKGDADDHEHHSDRLAKYKSAQQPQDDRSNNCNNESTRLGIHISTFLVKFNLYDFSHNAKSGEYRKFSKRGSLAVTFNEYHD